MTASHLEEHTMQVATTLASVATVAALLGGTALAGDHSERTNRHASRAERIAAANAPWQAIPNLAEAGMPGHGWQYFANPQAAHAVVISPEGHYYFSRGKGLRWVAAAPAAMDPPTAPWQAVENAAQAGMPGFGWQYFFDPVAPRAVVISPDGHYYLSQGQGLHWITAAQQPASMGAAKG